jgi:hypothetical protein
MSEAREPLTLIQAAEASAEAGNYASAEDLLREAARLQEASLGPRHPDLANTLNNIGIVCELTGKPDEAEQYFRRAVSIARTSLHPDHPFVATSQKNLRDFCEARGRKVELPAPAPEVRKPAAAATADPEPEDPEIASKRLFRRFALGALGPIAMLMVVLAAGLPRLGALPPPTPLPEFAINSPRDAVSYDSVSHDAAPGDAAPPPAPAPVEAPPAPEENSPTAAPPAVAARAVVVRASLCGGLDDWLCDPADRPVPTGPLFFYTQIKATSATTVQHRWYQDDRLHQTVTLRVQVNRAGGYRTYSQNLMKSESAGNWRVELRSEDDVLLHEERFTVR